jgi:hypothetical protein
LGLTELQEMSGSASSVIRNRRENGRRRICISNPENILPHNRPNN